MSKIGVMLISLIMLSACSPENNTTQATEENSNDSIERLVIPANYHKYENEKDLNEDADLIVIASPNDSFINREHVATYTPAEEYLPESLENFYTINTSTIKEVLKPAEESDIPVGSELDVIEPVAIVDTGEWKQILTIDNYLEMDENINYIIYLKRNTYGEYGVINMNNGRFNLEAEEQITNPNEPNLDEDEHEVFKKEVLERFEEEIGKYQ